MFILDEKDVAILEILQKNCRESLTNISKKINLSVDAVKKRIKRMIERKIFYPKVQLRPWNFGFKNIVEVKVKLQNTTKEGIDEFLEYLKQNPRISELFSVSGEWDLSFVLLTKDAADLAIIVSEIRTRFSTLINSWSELTTLGCHKFEDYNMKELCKELK